jgi:hypothetical protein
MATRLTLEYWIDDVWFVGRLKEVSGLFSYKGALQTRYPWFWFHGYLVNDVFILFVTHSLRL